MDKVCQLTKEQFETLNKATEKKALRLFWEMIGSDPLPKYKLGDTMILIENPELYGVYKQTHANNDHYYLVVNVVSETMAFTWSFYKCVME